MIPAPLKNVESVFLSKEDHKKTGTAYLAVFEADKIVSLAKTLLTAGYHLEDISGLVVREGAVSVYHFDHFDKPGRVTVLVIAPHSAAKFPSIAHVYQGAEWHERETRDFYGFVYEGNPNLVPLLLPEDMPDVHPLQKEESALASLATLFSAPGREREVVVKASGFTLLDAAPAEEPAKDAPKAETAPAAKAEAAPKEAPKAAAKTAETASEPVKAAPKEAAKPKGKAEPKPQGKVAKTAPKKSAVKGGNNA